MYVLIIYLQPPRKNNLLYGLTVSKKVKAEINMMDTLPFDIL